MPEPATREHEKKTNIIGIFTRKSWPIMLKQIYATGYTPTSANNLVLTGLFWPKMIVEQDIWAKTMNITKKEANTIALHFVCI